MSNLPYRIVIGLEVHVQLLTRSKLFCGCRTEFGLPSNSATCPVCTGLPGALPVMNRQTFELALKAALALNCQIAPFTKWDRKNYFYPDLPKNYQITQYDLPFSRNGLLRIETAEGPKDIQIRRIHLEEDAGKMLHDETGMRRDSKVDLNRAGTPLLEIVTEPVLKSAEDARRFLEEVRLLMRELEVSDCEMQEGSLRCDANVNLQIPVFNYIGLPIVEVKNLNSFRAVERAIKYEEDKQYRNFLDWDVTRSILQSIGKTYEELSASGQQISDSHSNQLAAFALSQPKGTVGWDDVRGRTIEQRRKEEAADYRYFPEPDLVPVTVDAARVEQVRASLGELPAVQRARLPKEYGLSDYDAGVLTSQGRAFVTYFEEAARSSGDPKAASNWLTNQVLQTLNERKQTICEFPVSAAALGDLIRRIKESGLNMQRAREVYARMVEQGVPAEQAIKDLGFTVVADEGQLVEIVRRAIAANPKAVADFKNGKVKAADAIKGAVMRETKGMAKADVVQQVLMRELGKE